MPGTIVFRPIEANIVTKDKDLVGKMDPYLSFHLGGLKRVKGQVAKSGGQHPVWNDAITVEVTNQTSLTVDLKDKDMLIDDKIGSFEVDLRELEAQGQVRKWYPIIHNNEPAGELLMEAVYNGGNMGQQGFNQGNQGYNQGLNQGNQGYNQGFNQGSQGFSQGLNQGVLGTRIISQESYPIQSTQSTMIPQNQLGGLQQNQYSEIPQNQFGSMNQNQYEGLPQNQFVEIPQNQFGGQQQQFGGQQFGGQQFGGQQFGGQPQNQMGSQIPSSEQLAREAVMRGSDPLNTQQNYIANNQGQGLGGYGGQGQNLTQTHNFSGTDPLLYEGDKNRFSNPAQQVPYGAHSTETYNKHGHGKHGNQGNQGNQNAGNY